MGPKVTSRSGFDMGARACEKRVTLSQRSSNKLELLFGIELAAICHEIGVGAAACACLSGKPVISTSTTSISLS
jgi:hypothetical protein